MPPALGLGQRGHAEAPVQLVPLQRLEARADPALQPARGHAARRGHGLRYVEDEDGERSCEEHQEPHRHTSTSGVYSLCSLFVSTLVSSDSLLFLFLLVHPLLFLFLLCVHFKSEIFIFLSLYSSVSFLFLCCVSVASFDFYVCSLDFSCCSVFSKLQIQTLLICPSFSE